MSDPYGPPNRYQEAPIAPSGPRHASRKPGPPEPSSPRRGPRRPRSVRAKLVAALLVPVVSLIALWSYVTLTTVRDAAAQGDLWEIDVLGTGAAGLVVLLGFAAVILSVLLAVHVGRRLIVNLVGLRDAATDLAANKLPNALRRLHAGDRVNIDAEVSRTEHGGDEVGQINDALDEVYRTALRAAVERSHVVRGISSVYVHLARRSQVLLHRQLELLDAMERRTEDPQDLENLFRMDHLTTRMRRQAESLIILSGGSPARHWRYPVPAIDVVRAAIAEVEDFTRVEVQEMADTRVAGGAVADLTHLIAELVENAITFSPPHTKALVRGRLVPVGLAIEIEDRGLGMSDEALEDANRRVQDTGQVDLLEAEQLGHFVVNRLAHRQKVEVTLQRSSFGGVTAVVLIPDRLLDRESVRADASASRSGDGSPADAQPGVAQRDVRESPWQVISPATGRNGSTPDEGHVLAEAEVAGTDVRSAVTEVDPGDVAEPRPAERGGVPPPRSAAGDDGAGSERDLPRRVRQANLVPELRDDEPRGAPPTERSERDRTPEQARATLEALRTGWLRGRKDSDVLQGDQQ